MNDLSKICLGTVKLGVPNYGFSSRPQEPNFEALHFLNQAEALGIHRFDTSPRYGNAEQILGTYIEQSQNTPVVSSKIDELNTNDVDSPKKMRTSVKKSLSALNLEKLDICYLHQNELRILSDAYIQKGLQQLKSDGTILATGASVYSIEECEYAMAADCFDYIQIPVNICDVRFHKLFLKNKSTRSQFVARSVFLQGIILNQEQIPQRIKHSADILPYLADMDTLAKQYHISLTEMALSFVSNLPNLHHVIIGTTNLKNLKSNLCATNTQLPPQLFNTIYEKASIDKFWANPRVW